MERKRNTSGFDPGDKGSIPFKVTKNILSPGVIGNTPDFGSGECRFEPCGDN